MVIAEDGAGLKSAPVDVSFIEPEWVAPQRVATAMGWHRRTVIRWVTDLGCPGKIENGRVRVQLDRVTEWFNRERPDLSWRERLAASQKKAHTNRTHGWIYTLKDPRDGTVVYVGLDSHHGKRITEHLRKIRRGSHSNWKLRRLGAELQHEGLVLVGEIVEAVLGFSLCEREIELIGYWRKRSGDRLCNLTEGGDISDHAPEIKEKLSEIGKRKWKDETYKANWLAAKDRMMAARYGVTIEDYSANRHLYSSHQKDPKLAERRAHFTKIRLEREVKLQSDATLFRSLTPVTFKGSCFVPLTQGRYAIIDAGEWDRVSKHRWNVQRKGGMWRAKSKIDGDQCLLHRFILSAKKGDALVSPKNGNHLDCRYGNLNVLEQNSGRPAVQKPILSDQEIFNMTKAMDVLVKRAGCESIVAGMVKRIELNERLKKNALDA